ncbi:MAG: glycosyltransferase family 39 protein [Ginsengibacter sp.]
MTFIKKYHLLLFLTAWTLFNFFQAANTVLLNDAYYWAYSNFLDWGYFDHPPMIAALIKAGFFLFHNELGVRFFILILNALTILIIYNLLTRRNDVLFYAIVCSIAVLQIGGFIAVPDIPLIFFVALFFLVYKNFLASSSWGNTILLGIVMALMLYSKYHGVLIILFTIISNPALLKNTKAYVAVLIGALLFMPHVYWEYKHGFPSVIYQLFERNESTYRLRKVTEYIEGQILFAGPLMGWLLLWGAFMFQSANLFERALKFSLVGIYVFFLFSNLKGKVEANWTAPVLIPLIVLSHQYFYNKKIWQRILIYAVPISLALVFFVRFYLISDNKFIKALNTNEFEQNKKWSREIKSFSGGLPVVFIDSYQKASKYWFYSGIESFSLNSPDYRRNNYNFWPIEKSMQGKTVYVMAPDNPLYFTDSVPTTAGMLRARRIDSFYSYSGVQLNLEGSLVLDQQKNLITRVGVKNVEAGELKALSEKLELNIFQKDKFIRSYQLVPSNIDTAARIITGTASEQVFLPSGKYIVTFSILTRLPGYSSLNSAHFTLVIK